VPILQKSVNSVPEIWGVFSNKRDTGRREFTTESQRG
jgi:hypothetical protein